MPAHDVTYAANIYDGIDYICRDADKVNVYTVTGSLIGRSIDPNDLKQQLASGIYIINGKKVLVK